MAPSETLQFAEQLLAAKPQLASKLARALLCSPAQVQQGLGEVIKFLVLAAENKVGMLTPSRRVDLAWHELILYTRTYSEFCMQQFGKPIHHEPDGEMAANQRQYRLTLDCYRARFGEPDKEWWDSPDQLTEQCGSCESNT
jgi:hypothetical protein